MPLLLSCLGLIISGSLVSVSRVGSCGIDWFAQCFLFVNGISVLVMEILFHDLSYCPVIEHDVRLFLALQL